MVKVTNKYFISIFWVYSSIYEFWNLKAQIASKSTIPKLLLRKILKLVFLISSSQQTRNSKYRQIINIGWCAVPSFQSVSNMAGHQDRERDELFDLFPRQLLTTRHLLQVHSTSPLNPGDQHNHPNSWSWRPYWNTNKIYRMNRVLIHKRNSSNTLCINIQKKSINKGAKKISYE